MIEFLFNKFGYYKKSTFLDYHEIEYNVPGTPEENSENLIQAAAFGHKWIQAQSENDYKSTGMLFTVILLIEHKLEDLLLNFDPEIKNKTLGNKIETFKEFLKRYEPSNGEDIQIYRNLIAPLLKVKKIRNNMAHDISKLKPSVKELEEIESYVKNTRLDLKNVLDACPDDDSKYIGIISCFGFAFSATIAKLRVHVK